MTTATRNATLELRCSGPVWHAEVDYARSKLSAALHHASQPVLLARARLTMHRDPALERPAVAQVNIDLNGHPIRCQVSRASMNEAVDALHDCLIMRMQRAAEHWEAIRGSRPVEEPAEWRHTRRVVERPEYFPRPLDERRTVRHKSFTPVGATVEEAAFDMDMLGYSFHLFTESGSGQVSVLYRGAAGLRLLQLEPHPELVTEGATPFTTSRERSPVLTEQEAAQRLEQTGWPFVFFRDATTGSGRLLYHRYDGDYGLITPAG